MPGMDGDAVWAADNQTLFYVTKDEQERWVKAVCLAMIITHDNDKCEGKLSGPCHVAAMRYA